MNKTIKFDVENAEIIDENPDSQFATAKLRIFSSGQNRHDLVCSEDVLQKTASTIYEKPILYSIDEQLQDFYTHKEADENAIAGFVTPNSAEFERLDDGRLSLNVFAKIWKLYAPKVMDLFKRDGGNKKVSVEMDLFAHSPRTDGMDDMLDFAYAGVTILGDYITEASPGANMQMLSFAEENQKVRDAYKEEFGNGDFVPYWAEKILEKLDEINLKFEGGIMPYASLKDANPAIRGIDPPVSLSQANEIAHNADSIGTDENKNGWAIAISQFKKGHVAKDGHWIKKEKMADDNNEIDENFAVSKDEMGSGEAVTVDKSKDSMSSSPWGDVNKTELMHKVLKAKNYRALVHDVYLLVDEGWEDHPSSSLHYPVMQINGGKAVYNQHGVSSALQRAEGQNESGVVSKAKGLHSKLGLDKPEGNKKKEAMSMENTEKEKMATETAEQEKQEDPKEEAQETPEEEKKENMAFDFAAMFAESDENFATLQEEFAKGDMMNHPMIMNAMYAKFCNLQTQMAALQTEKEEMATKFAEADQKAKAYMAENEELKQFKTQKEQEQKQFAIDTTLKDLEEKVEIPEDVLEEMREDSNNFSLDNIETWKNKVKARGLDFAVKSESENEIKHYALPFKGSERTDNGSPWTR